MRHQTPAVPSRARTEIDHVVRAPDRLFIVLDHQHGVAQVAQILQRIQQPVVVAMVQSDRRLIEHIEHAAQLRANLRRQPNALPFAARQSRRRAIERDVSQPHGIQELQPLDNFMHDAPGNRCLAPRQLDALRHAPTPAPPASP